jgi:uncharacterized protein GlcG (DUF336 family)
MTEESLLHFKTLSLSHAQTMIQAIIDASNAAGHPGLAIAVVDVAGKLIAAARMDGKAARFMGAAQRKAYTAAVFERDTTGVAKFLTHKQAEGLSDWDDSSLTTLPGGNAVFFNKTLVGGLGVAGGFGELSDIHFADVGVAALGRGYHHSETWIGFGDAHNAAK